MLSAVTHSNVNHTERQKWLTNSSEFKWFVMIPCIFRSATIKRHPDITQHDCNTCRSCATCKCVLCSHLSCRGCLWRSTWGWRQCLDKREVSACHNPPDLQYPTGPAPPNRYIIVVRKSVEKDKGGLANSTKKCEENMNHCKRTKKKKQWKRLLVWGITVGLSPVSTWYSKWPKYDKLVSNFNTVITIGGSTTGAQLHWTQGCPDSVIMDFFTIHYF